MKASLLSLLVCPSCHSELTAPRGKDLIEGKLACSGCGADYPVRGGIPRFVWHGGYAGSFVTRRSCAGSANAVRGNHFAKPLRWKPGEPGFANRRFTVKNLFELKDARRVLVEGNLLEHSGSQRVTWKTVGRIESSR